MQQLLEEAEAKLVSRRASQRDGSQGSKRKQLFMRDFSNSKSPHNRNKSLLVETGLQTKAAPSKIGGNLETPAKRGRASGSGAPRDSAEESYYSIKSSEKHTGAKDVFLSSGSSKKTENPSIISVESSKNSFGPGPTQAATTGATEPGHDTANQRNSLPRKELLKKRTYDDDLLRGMKQFEEECSGKPKIVAGTGASKLDSKRANHELKNLLQGLQRGTERKDDSRPKLRNEQREESGGRKKREDILEEVKRSCQPKAKKKGPVKKKIEDRIPQAIKNSKRHVSEEKVEKQEGHSARKVPKLESHNPSVHGKQFLADL